MRRTALTFIGRDRPGIIAEVSRVLFESGCNVEDTTMTILEEQFAMILIASIPTKQAEKRLKEAFNRCKRKWGLSHFWNILPANLLRGEKHLAGSKTYIVSVAGKDRTGIVYETSRVLARAGLNITDLNSKILGQGEKAIFAMILEFDVPKAFNTKRLDRAWRQLQAHLRVDVHVRPLERLPL